MGLDEAAVVRVGGVTGGEAAARRSSFYVGFLFLPSEKRRALTEVYGFCRMIDDIVDSGELTRVEAEKRLEFWREEIARLYEGRPGHPVSQALAYPVERFALPRQAFLDLIGGCAMDLERRRYEDFKELEAYLYGVAVTVGLLCVEIFGYRHSDAARVREYATHLGYAFQLTNILRDVGADLEMGRIYLPLSEMRAAGYCVEELHSRQHNKAFVALMEAQYARAKGYYARARTLLDPRDRAGMLAAELMARHYEGVLDEIRRRQYRVFFERIGLSPWQKLRLAAAGCAYSYGLVTP